MHQNVVNVKSTYLGKEFDGGVWRKNFHSLSNYIFEVLNYENVLIHKVNKIYI